MTLSPMAKDAGLGQDHEVPLPGVVLAVHGVPPAPETDAGVVAWGVSMPLSQGVQRVGGSPGS